MTPVLHPDAEREVREAHAYYEGCRAGLGDEFVAAVGHAIAAACENPNRWPRMGRSFRRCRTERFKYGIIYHVVENNIEVVAVMDLRRKPDYWRKRLRK